MFCPYHQKHRHDYFGRVCMYMTIYFDHSNAIGAESALLMIIIICWGLQTYKKGNEIASSR